MVHGVPIRTAVEVPAWYRSTDHPDSWTLTVTGPEDAPYLAECVRSGGAQWCWEEDSAHGRTAITITGGDHPGGAGRFTIDWRQREVLLDHAGTATLDGLLDLASRWIIPVIAARRGRAMVLHGTVVATPAGAVAVCGPSGVGKSTLSVALALDGGQIISDEPAVITTDDSGATIWQGGSPLRLHADSLPSEVPPGHAVRGLDLYGKHLLAPVSPGSSAGHPVRAVLLLGPRHPGQPPLEAARLETRGAIIGLTAQRYTRARDVELNGLAFQAAAAVAAQVPVFAISLTDDLGAVRGTARLILDLVSGTA